MGNVWHAFIKSILHIFSEKSHSKLLSHTLKKGGVGGRMVATNLLTLPQNCVICIVNNVFNRKKVHKITEI